VGSDARAGGAPSPRFFAWRWAVVFLGSSSPVFNPSRDKRLEVSPEGGEPSPGCGTRADPVLLRWRRPRGCLPRSEQILRSTQLLKESFCRYSAFPCVCGATRAPRHRGWASPGTWERLRGGSCPWPVIALMPLPHRNR